MTPVIWRFIDEHYIIIGFISFFVFGILVGTNCFEPKIQRVVEYIPSDYYALLQEAFMDTSLTTSCDGIEYYTSINTFNASNFKKDVEALKSDYWKHYDNEEGNPLGLNMKLLPPSAMRNNTKGIDCEDLAHWINCLDAHYITVKCKPRIERWGGNTLHVAMTCVADDEVLYF